jgi:hypothetical protein
MKPMPEQHVVVEGSQPAHRRRIEFVPGDVAASTHVVHAGDGHASPAVAAKVVAYQRAAAQRRLIRLGKAGKP